MANSQGTVCDDYYGPQLIPETVLHAEQCFFRCRRPEADNYYTTGEKRRWCSLSSYDFLEVI
jgi:hypothetical protein